MTNTLTKVTKAIQTNPQSAESLILYALISSLRMEKSGFMFILRKLRDLSPANRQLAYDLMELMATNGNQGVEWEAGLEAIDNAVKGLQ
jgi:hypothetical protein